METRIDVGLALIQRIEDTDLRDKLYQVFEAINRELNNLQDKIREIKR